VGWGSLWGGGWGGGGPLGPGPLGVFELLSARAMTNKSVRLTFSVAPLLDSPIIAGDSSNLRNWTLQRTDASQMLTLLAVRPVSGDVNSADLFIAESWAAALAEYKITGSDVLVSAGNDPIVSPAIAYFYGSPAVYPATERKENVLDVKNVQVDPDLFSGSLVVDDSGDYENESGISLLKKLIIRELVTAQGEFVHLADTDYGLGLREKALWRSSDLVMLQKQCELRVARQLEVESASVTVDLYSDDRLVIGIRAKTTLGPLEFSYSSRGAP
jgi:hypothetical protein